MRVAEVEAVLWDYGGVFTASPFSAVVELAATMGCEADDLLAAIFGPYDRDTDHAWHRLERGEIPFTEAREEIIALGAEKSIDSDPLKFFASMAGAGGGVHDSVVALAHRVRASGRKSALITNNAHEFREHWRKTLPLDELFHEVIDSSEVAMRKPDPRIFQLAFDRLGVAAECCVFLDDYPGNIAAAEALGVRGILVEDDPSGAVAALERLL